MHVSTKSYWKGTVAAARKLAVALMVFLYAPAVFSADIGPAMCGDYEYTPLSGFRIQNDPIEPGSPWMLLNMAPWRRTQKDIDTPTIYCRTEENQGDFSYKLPQKEELLVRTLAKQETRVGLSDETCEGIGKDEVYFLYSLASQGSTQRAKKSYHELVVIEFNEPGNRHSSIFIISPGNLDDLNTNWKDAGLTKRQVMCERAKKLIATVTKP